MSGGEDPDHSQPVSGYDNQKYCKISYPELENAANEISPSASIFSTGYLWMIIAIVLIAIAVVAVIFIFRKNNNNKAR